ncbi:tctex1 domain-containing protein 1 isoform X1 [Motacilla alba alba]|uniref:tctex1 domain-containing protein 1 isoform X1 n=1 Tax=Motacilla alba alba TaxID=1094192 RepID=UPI0018D4DE3F|nr:tctex1 domain-containing protein 1 isoform X1 [Motacilla alba alba]
MEGGESPAEPGSGPARRFPVAAVEEILRDVLGSVLRERRYEPGPCREAAKDIAEVVKARVKALEVPRKHYWKYLDQGIKHGFCLPTFRAGTDGPKSLLVQPFPTEVGSGSPCSESETRLFATPISQLKPAVRFS